MSALVFGVVFASVLSEAASAASPEIVARVSADHDQGQVGASAVRVAENLYLTSATVVKSARKIIVSVGGDAIDATVVATDAPKDLALLKAEGTGPNGPVAAVATPIAATGGKLLLLSAGATGVIEHQGVTTDAAIKEGRFTFEASAPASAFGGAVTDACGRLLGISVGGVPRSDLIRKRALQGSLRALRIDQAVRFLSANNITLGSNPSPCLVADAPPAVATPDAAKPEVVAPSVDAGQASGDQTPKEPPQNPPNASVSSGAQAEAEASAAAAAAARKDAAQARARAQALEEEVKKAAGKSARARAEAEAAAEEARLIAEEKAKIASDLEAAAQKAAEDLEAAKKARARIEQALWISVPALIGALLLVALFGALGVRRKAKAERDAKGRAHEAQAEAATLRRKIAMSENAPDWLLTAGDRVLKLSGSLLARDEGLLFGRHQVKAGVVFEADDVSRSHARFRLSDGVLTVEDVGSLNGTFVNGVALQPEEPMSIEDGDEIRTASHRFIVRRA